MTGRCCWRRRRPSGICWRARAAEERTEDETETPSWIKAAYEAGPEHYDTVLDRGLSAIGREVMDIANRHKKDLPLVIAVLRMTIAPAGAAHDRRGAGDAPVDSAQRRGGGSDGRAEIKKGPGQDRQLVGASDEGSNDNQVTPL